MFTGIVEETGIIKSLDSNRISVKCDKVLEQTKLGDSIAINGVCLTVTELQKDCFTADVSRETLRVTNFSTLRTGCIVNLERALALKDRLGGHIVSGHVDGTAKILAIEKYGEFYKLQILISPEISKYVVKKGSITINGISLTVAETQDDVITISIIPHTFKNTNLQFLKSCDYVNIEADILSKYVEKFLLTSDNKSTIDENFLQRNGF